MSGLGPACPLCGGRPCRCSENGNQSSEKNKSTQNDNDGEVILKIFNFVFTLVILFLIFGGGWALFQSIFNPVK